MVQRTPQRIVWQESLSVDSLGLYLRLGKFFLETSVSPSM